jgi:hypothetical protein
MGVWKGSWRISKSITFASSYGVERDVIWLNHIPSGGKPVEKGNHLMDLVGGLQNPRVYAIRKEWGDLIITGGNIGDYFVGFYEYYDDPE